MVVDGVDEAIFNLYPFFVGGSTWIVSFESVYCENLKIGFFFVLSVNR